MNESGRFVAAFAHYHKIETNRILVCFDDVALPLGRLRLRPQGSAGGQKGMQSIIEALGTQEIARLRIGVGPQPAGVDSADYVLAPFTPLQERELSSVLESAASAAQRAARDGLPAAMSEFNREHHGSSA